MGFSRDIKTVVSLFTPVPVGGGGVSIEHPYLVSLAGVLRGSIVVSPLVLIAVLGLSGGVLAPVLVVSLHILSQGLLHVEGLVDFSEALLAKRLGVDPLRVLKDRYRGSYGVVSGSLYIASLLYIVSGASGDPLRLAWSLFVAELIEVAVLVLVVYVGREEPYEGMARFFKKWFRGSLDVVETIASIVSIASLATALYTRDLLASSLALLEVVATALIVSLVVVYTGHRVLGFVNGDVLGFGGELGYLSVLLVLLYTPL